MNCYHNALYARSDKDDDIADPSGDRVSAGDMRSGVANASDSPSSEGKPMHEDDEVLREGHAKSAI